MGHQSWNLCENLLNMPCSNWTIYWICLVPNDQLKMIFCAAVLKEIAKASGLDASLVPSERLEKRNK